MVYSASKPHVMAESELEAGRYLVLIGGCQNCHTPGWEFNPGKIPEALWLTGTSLGWRGPWGTTYPSNLRLYVQKYDEEAFLLICHENQFRPPMPGYDLMSMSDQDLIALYRYIKSLGPAGVEAPAYLPHGQQPTGPVVDFPAPPPDGMMKH